MKRKSDQEKLNSITKLPKHGFYNYKYKKIEVKSF
jgi:hypothetical protein